MEPFAKVMLLLLGFKDLASFPFAHLNIGECLGTRLAKACNLMDFNEELINPATMISANNS